MSQIKEIVKDSAVYSIATLVSQFIGIFTSIAMRRFLTPEMMGIWTTLLVVLNYSLFAELGIFTAIAVKIPYLKGKNASVEIQKMRDIAFTFGIAVSLFVIIVLFAGSFMLSRSMPDYVILGIRIVAFTIAATFFYNLYVVMLRADKNFFLLSKSIVVNSLAMLVFTAVLTYFFKLKGIYFATLFATVVSLAYIKFNTGYNLKLCFDMHLASSLSRIGIPILIAGITHVMLLSVDKIMIIKMLGAEKLGFYSIAILTLTYAHNFPKLFTIVLFPTMQEEFGRNDSKERALEYVKQPILLMAYIFPAILALAYFGIPILVHYVLPKYIMGIDSMKMLLCGCFFISFVPLMHNFIITINKQMILIPMTAAAILFGVAMNYGAIKLGYGIMGVAFGTSVAYFLCFLMMFIYVLAHCEKWSAITKSFFHICVPFVYSVIILIALERFIKMDSIVFGTIVQALVFYAAYIPMLWYINNKMKLTSKLFRRGRKILPKESLVINDILTEV